MMHKGLSNCFNQDLRYPVKGYFFPKIGSPVLRYKFPILINSDNFNKRIQSNIVSIKLVFNLHASITAVIDGDHLARK
jgi:hypothetical protein